MFLPQGGLAISVASTVWVGAVVTCLLNLRLGWTLAGIVIPGYLAPIFIIKPLVAFIDIFEGIFAYLLVKLVAELGVRSRKWDNFFGRERFFALIISSVLVRLIFDGLVLKYTAHYLQIHYNYQIDYYSNLNSYGLVVVALIANQFWKEGLRNQIVPFSITILLTYLIVRFGLIEFSNFKISQIESLYSNIEEVFASTPKVYIILLITTLIATRMSLKYGWDYGGILIAGLLALQWYSPLRVAMSLSEALIIYFVASILLKTKYFEQMNIVHSRKILLFFNIGFLYRILVGDLVMNFLPEERVLEYYGFGYLLSTLIALKMHDNNSSIKVATMVLYTSLGGIVLGSLIAFGLNFVTGNYRISNTVLAINELKSYPLEVETKQGYLHGVIQTYRNDIASASGLSFDHPELSEIYTIDRLIVNPLIQLVLNYKGQENELKENLHKINGFAANYGYKITFFQDLTSAQKFLIFSPNFSNDKTKNWGMFIFRLQTNNDQVIEVPRPFDEASTLDFAAYLFVKTQSQFLLIGGSASNANKDRSSDLTRPQSKVSLYNLISQVLLRDHQFNKPVIQLRGYSMTVDSSAKADTDVLIAFSDGAIRDTQLTDRQKEIVNLIEQEKLIYNIVAADEKTSGYEVGQLFLSRYLIQTPNKDIAVIWLSPWLRAAFRDPENNFLSISHYKATEITEIEESLVNLLSNLKPQAGWRPSSELKAQIELYLNSRDVVVLENIVKRFGYSFKHVFLTDDGRDYLAIFDNKDNLLGFASLYQNADVSVDYLIQTNEKSRLDLSFRRWIMFKES